ncbi:MAG: ROK family protein [Actinomycetaceae bacterium]|nr:ROK family protein [Actinomycetaceae bacterium]
MGVDLRIDRWAILVRDLSGQELARDRFLPEANAGAPAVLKGIAGVIKRLTANLPHELMGIGVAVGGTPRPDHRGLLRSHYLEWRNVDVQAILREELQSPDLQCFVHDVASCAAEANATILPNEDRSELLHLQCGIGLGAGEPSPLHVSIPDAFKTNYIGHLPFGAIEEPCQVCGWKGCVDSVLGFHALVKRTEQLGITVRETPDFIIEYCQELVARWEAGDKLAEEIIGDLALDLAKLIVLLIMSKEVSVITLGGWSSHLGDRFVTLVEDIVRSNRLSSHAKVEVSQSGDDASAIGAAMLGAMVGITARLVKNDPE